MNRSGFLRHLLAGSALLFLPGTGGTEKEVKDIRLSSPYVAGFQYYGGTEIGTFLNENDILLLKREPDNPYDCYAVEVFRDKVKLGYLPRNENMIIARMMDQGVIVKAMITGIDMEAHPCRMVKMKVFYQS
jgi:hypothetical protein